jgi:hypothetical protein
MANTYTLISSNVLTSSAASVTFSSIPSTYTDLVVRYSARATTGGTDEPFDIQFNSDTANNYSRIFLRGSGSAAASGVLSAYSAIRLNQGTNGNSVSTSSTFTNGECYIPSYTASQYKAVSAFTGLENNGTEAYLVATAGLWSSNSAINTITLFPSSSGSFASGSSFYLYGIKNS